MDTATIQLDSLTRLGSCVLGVDEAGKISWVSECLTRLLGRTAIGDCIEISECPVDRPLVSLGIPTSGGEALLLRGTWMTVLDGGHRVFVGAPDAQNDVPAQLGDSIDDFPADDTWLNYLIQVDECTSTQTDAQERIRQLKLERAKLKKAHDEMQEARRAALNMLADVADAKSKADATREELEQAHAATSQLLEAVSSVLIGVDTTGRITVWNGAAELALGIGSDAARGRSIEELPIDWDHQILTDQIAECRNHCSPVRIEELRFKRHDGTDGFLSVTLNPVSREAVRTGNVLIVATDITEQKILHTQLAQSQKLESIGQLAAGIAHEINTPTQYVGDNVRFLQDSVNDLIEIVDRYAGSLDRTTAPKSWEERNAEIRAAIEELDVEFLKVEVPKAIEQSLEGVERVARIVRAMKDFSHPGSQGSEYADLNKAIESTITVARNEWKYVAEMETDFDPTLPPILCLVGEFNQVILNLIINAAHAIAEVAGKDTEAKGTITVTTQAKDQWAEICIGDTGAGIPEENKAKVFDHFFTTKEVGKGTGQGLAIAYAVITEKHGGAISFESEIGKGTTFVIRIPIDPPNELHDLPTQEAVGSIR